MEAFNTFLGKVESAIINPIIELIAVAAFVLFVWGVVEFIRGAGNQEARQKGQQHMVWGIIGLVIIFGAKGIIAVLAGVFGIAAP
ncbi:MAG: seg [Parcubacteria group bacterium]|nr:seg [Parcubacteria group bacterium]